MSGNDANTLYITKVVGDVTISPKSDVPSFEKKSGTPTTPLVIPPTGRTPLTTTSTIRSRSS